MQVSALFHSTNNQVKKRESMTVIKVISGLALVDMYRY